MPLSGNIASKKEIIVKGLLQPVSLAVDWIGHNLYIVDKPGRRIDLVSLDNYYQHNILSYTMSPSDIALDPNRGFVQLLQCSQ